MIEDRRGGGRVLELATEGASVLDRPDRLQEVAVAAVPPEVVEQRVAVLAVGEVLADLLAEVLVHPQHRDLRVVADTRGVEVEVVEHRPWVARLGRDEGVGEERPEDDVVQADGRCRAHHVAVQAERLGWIGAGQGRPVQAG